MERFITLSYWLDRFPDVDFKYGKITLGLAVLVFAIGLAIHFYRKKTKNEALKKALRRVPGPFFSHAVILAVLLFFRENLVPYLSMRLWFLLLAVSFLYKTIRNLLKARSDYKKRIKA